MANITCGHCTATHLCVTDVRACYDGIAVPVVAPCHWAVERYFVCDDETGEGETRIVDCGVDATFTDRGWTCKAGHEHVRIEARISESWDFAADAGEAYDLFRAGVQPYTMDGHLATSERDFDYAR